MKKTFCILLLSIVISLLPAASSVASSVAGTADGYTSIYSREFIFVTSHERIRRTLEVDGRIFNILIMPGVDSEWEHPGDFAITLEGQGKRKMWLINGDTFNLPRERGKKGDSLPPEGRGLYTLDLGRYRLRVQVLKTARRYHVPSSTRRFIRTVFKAELSIAEEFSERRDRPQVFEDKQDSWFGGTLRLSN